MQLNREDNILKFSMVALCVSSVAAYFVTPIGPTIMWWMLRIGIFIVLYVNRDKTFRPVPIILWMVLVLVSCIVGCFYCRDYWDWKQFINKIIAYTVCVVALVACQPDMLKKLLYYLFKYIWVLFVLLVFVMTSTGIGKFLIPFSFLALFYPLLNSKSKWYVWIALALTILIGTDSRSDILKMLVCIALGVLLMHDRFQKYMKRWYWLFFVLPFMLFMLAANHTFNIFEVGENIFGVEESEGDFDFSDTRTILYEDVIASALERHTVFFGVTPAGTYHSEWMIRNMDSSDITGDIHYGERGGTESSVLNVFLHFGVLGLIIYLVLFMSASYLAINKSNNMYMVLIGFYVAFRFMMGWVEDIINLDVNMFLLWAMIGMCYSPAFREMTDEEFREWFDGVISG